MNSPKRIRYLDAIRGMALFIMVFANSIPYILQGEHPFAIRAIDSLAAPLFIGLAGYGISLGYQPGNMPRFDLRLVWRGLLTLLVAVLIDMLIWDIMPFTGFDVLYLIAFCILFTTLIPRVSNFWVLALILGIISASYYFQSRGYYQAQIIDYPLEKKYLSKMYNSMSSWFIHGWFPLLPWMAVFLLGYLGGRNKIRFGRYKLITSLLLILLVVFSLVLIHHENNLVRDGYSELFYPADLSYLIFACAFIALVWVNKNIFDHKAFIPFRILGRSSLFVYLMNMIISSLAIRFIYGLTNNNFIVTMLLVYLIIYALAGFLLYVKKVSSWKKTPYLIRFLFGS